MREPVWRWALPPLRPGASSSERGLRRREEMALEQQIRSIWTAFCSRVDLVERLGPTMAESWTPPTIGPITLGPPTRFSVCLHPGQLRTDLEDVRPRLAAAYEVDDVIVRDLVRGWATVELVEHGAGGAEPDAPGVPSDVGRKRRPLRPAEPSRPRHPFPRRARRGPFGGPRLGR